MKHKVGDDIYVTSAMHISRGSADRVGGLAKIKKFEKSPNNKNIIWVHVEEIPGVGFNYKSLLGEQARLKQQFGTNRAYPDPDIDTPFIEKGDSVNGKMWDGDDIW